MSTPTATGTSTATPTPASSGIITVAPGDPCPSGYLPGQSAGICLGTEPGACGVSAAYCASLAGTTPPDKHPGDCSLWPASCAHTTTVAAHSRPVTRHAGTAHRAPLASTGPDAGALAGGGAGLMLAGAVLLAWCRLRLGRHAS